MIHADDIVDSPNPCAECPYYNHSTAYYQCEWHFVDIGHDIENKGCLEMYGGYWDKAWRMGTIAMPPLSQRDQTIWKALVHLRYEILDSSYHLDQGKMPLEEACRHMEQIYAIIASLQETTS